MDEFIESLQPYMFDLENKARVERDYILDETRSACLSKIQELEDTLFWAIFAAHQGAQEFVDIETKYKNREILEKSKVAAAAMSAAAGFKHASPKMSRVAVTAAASGLLADARTDTSSIVLFAKYYGIRIRVIDARRNTYAEIDPDPTDTELPFIIIRRSYNGKTYAPVWREADAVDTVPTMFKLESLTKPLRAISNYTIQELRKLTEFFGIALESKAKKRDIYDTVWAYCSGGA